MLVKPTILAAVPYLIAETLESEYGVDPVPLFERAGLDIEKLTVAGARYPREQVLDLWDIAAQTSNDPCIGIVVGLRTRPTTFYSLGFSFLTSHTLLDALHRLYRYHSIIANMPMKIELKARKNEYILAVDYPDPRFPAPHISLDYFLTSIVQLCRAATNDTFHPTAVSLGRQALGNENRYEEVFCAPVAFSAAQDALHFDKAILEEHLPGDNVAVARANDKVADEYLSSLGSDKVSHDVRRLLLQMLPSGNIGRNRLAKRMYRSSSTLSRQLKEEGFAFRDILDDTRRSLAEGYIEQGVHSIAEITYLLGYSDQSNFSRAFKCWTGKSPSEYRAA